MDAALLSVEALEVHYGPVQAVRGISLAVYPGEMVALLGANGVGKSSTLNAIVGLAPVSGGAVHFSSTDVTRQPTERLVRRGLTLTPEGRRVFTRLSVLENLRVGAVGATRGSLRARLQSMFELFPVLGERRDQLAGTLSGGEQQMLAIARALMSEPRLLLLDEPSLGLAPQVVETVFELIAGLRERGVTVLLVEQNVAMSLDYVDRGYLMAGGHIVESGNAAELRASRVVEQTYLGVQ